MPAYLPFGLTQGSVTVSQTDHISIDGYDYPPQLHYSTDFKLDIGSKVLSIGDGTVISVYESVEDGTALAPVDHNFNTVLYPQLGPGATGNQITVFYPDLGLYVTYAHLARNSVPVEVGDTVSQGDPLGLVGLTGAGTGPNLHITYGITTTDWGGSSEDKYGLTTIANGSIASNPDGASLMFAEAPEGLVVGETYVSQNDDTGELVFSAVGTEFQVNTFTPEYQWLPSIAPLSDGGFLIVWDSSYADYPENGQDGSSSGIYAQRFSEIGTPVGSEFQVNTFTDDYQSKPSVSASPDGGIVVVWNSFGQDGSSAGVFAQRYAADGEPVGSEFQINTFTEDGQSNPDVVYLTDGSFAVVWESRNQDGDDAGIFGQRFSASGEPQGPEFQVNSYWEDGQSLPQITSLTDGGFVVSWVSNTSEGSSGEDSSGSGIFGQRYDAEGDTVGSEFQVNYFTKGFQVRPSLAGLADGGFVVTWMSDEQDGSRWGIFARRFDSEGTPIGSEFQVNTYTEDTQSDPSVVATSDGGFIVTWVSRGQNEPGYGIYAQRYSSDGEPAGSEFQVNTSTTFGMEEPVAAQLGDDRLVFAWTGSDEWSYGVAGQFYELTEAEPALDPDDTLEGHILSAVVALATAAYEENPGLADSVAGGTWSAYEVPGYGAISRFSLLEVGDIGTLDSNVMFREAVIDGQRVLGIAFSGTQVQGDGVEGALSVSDFVTQIGNWDELYEGHRDAILGALRWAGSADERGEDGFDQIVITGHSLGGILVEELMADFDPLKDDLATPNSDGDGTPDFERGLLDDAYGITFGSPGSPREVVNDDRLIQFVNLGDPVAMLSASSFFGLEADTDDPSYLETLLDAALFTAGFSENATKAIVEGALEQGFTDADLFMSRDGTTITLLQPDASDEVLYYSVFGIAAERHPLRGDYGYIENINQLSRFYSESATSPMGILEFWSGESGWYFLEDVGTFDVVLTGLQAGGFGLLNSVWFGTARLAIAGVNGVVSVLTPGLEYTVNAAVDLGEDIEAVASGSGARIRATAENLEEQFEDLGARFELIYTDVTDTIEHWFVGEGSAIITYDPSPDVEGDEIVTTVSGSFDLSRFQVIVAKDGTHVVYAETSDSAGDSDDNILLGASTDDTLLGHGGNDTLFGDAGADWIMGNDGNDLVLPSSGADTIEGGRGDDTIAGGQDVDVLIGDNGADFLIGDYLENSLDATGARIFRVYRATLDRAPDNTGYENWSARLDSGEMTLLEVIEGFVRSPEFQATYGALDNAAFVTLLYNNVLERSPDDPGLGNWVARLDAGMSRAQVVRGFSESAEFKEDTNDAASVFAAADALISNQLDDVFRLYQATLDRVPDLTGLENWATRLENGAAYVTVANGFVASVEFQSTYGALDNEAFVTQLYQNVLGRAPDATGLSNWTQRLEDGMSRAAVVQGFAQAPEFVANTENAFMTFMRSIEGDTFEGGEGDDRQLGSFRADHFVFDAADAGRDRVLQIDPWDTIELTGFGYQSRSEALAQFSEVGRDTVFTDGAVSVAFANSTLESLDGVTFLL